MRPLFSLAMICMQRDVDQISFRAAVDVLSDRDGAKHHLLTALPEANAAPPVDTWMIPSLLLSASPLKTALAVVSEVTLIAG
jgi:hypothetical protein